MYTDPNFDNSPTDHKPLYSNARSTNDSLRIRIHQACISEYLFDGSTSQNLVFWALWSKFITTSQSHFAKKNNNTCLTSAARFLASFQKDGTNLTCFCHRTQLPKTTLYFADSKHHKRKKSISGQKTRSGVKSFDTLETQRHLDDF